MLSEKAVENLKNQALKIRKIMIECAHFNRKYHFGGAFSLVEILTYLYFYELKNINLIQKERDKVILSKGHCCQTLYTIFELLGMITRDELNSYKDFGSILQGHPDMKRTPLIDFSSGSLGQGLSVSVGIALGYKIKSLKHNVYTIIGDGELQEGQIWEAAMSATKYKLDNLICFVDNNKLQVDGFVDDIMPIEPIKDKWDSFGWHVCCVDGHNFFDIDSAVRECKAITGKPKVIVSNTIKGKGVSFMEASKEWHSNKLTIDLKKKALEELEVVDNAE